MLSKYLVEKICTTTEEESSIGFCQEKFKKNRNHRTTFRVIMIASNIRKKNNTFKEKHPAGCFFDEKTKQQEE